MKFFAFLDDENSETVNLILDHNTTNYVAWVSKDDYENNSKAVEVGITYSNGTPEGTWGTNGNNNKGPLTVLSQLKTDTQNWSEELETPKSYTAKWNYSSQDYDYTIDYSDYRARLITAEEIAKITENDRAKGSDASSGPEENWGLGSKWFLLDKGTASCYNDRNCDTQNVTSKYWWLFDNTNCTKYGCKTADRGTNGYWTSSPHAGYSNYAWKVDYYGSLDTNVVHNDGSFGVRPVITVSKSKFLQ